MERSSSNSPILIYDRIDTNRRNARWLVVVLMVASAPVLLYLAHYVTAIFAMTFVMRATSSPGSLIAPIIGTSTALAILSMGLLAQLFHRYSADLVLRLTGAQPLDPADEPVFAKTVENLCIGAGLPKPRLAIVESASINMYSTGLEPDHASLVATRGLLDALDRQELEGVAAQELSQIGNGDVRLGTILATTVTLMLLPHLIAGAILKAAFRVRRGLGIACVVFLIYLGLMLMGTIVVAFGVSDEFSPDPTTRLMFMIAMLFPFYALFIGPGIGYLLRFAVSREREFLADADAALLTRYPPGLTRALAKMGVPGNAAIDTQASIAHLWIVDPRKPSPACGRFFETHPPINERIDALSRMGGATREMISRAETAGRRYRDRVTAENDGVTIEQLTGFLAAED